jgi:hypothetical protein
MLYGFVMFPMRSTSLHDTSPDMLVKYCAFTDKVKCYCYFPTPGRGRYNIVEFILLFYETIRDWCRENFVALGGSSRETGSASCVPIYQ